MLVHWYGLEKLGWGSPRPLKLFTLPLQVLLFLLDLKLFAILLVGTFPTKPRLELTEISLERGDHAFLLRDLAFELRSEFLLAGHLSPVGHLPLLRILLLLLPQLAHILVLKREGLCELHGLEWLGEGEEL